MRKQCKECMYYQRHKRSKAFTYEQRRTRVIARIMESMRDEDVKGYELAAMVKVTPPRISQILNQKRNLTIKVLCAMEDALQTKFLIY